MKLMQGTFSSLPPLGDDEIRAQVACALSNGWTIGIEHSPDPHPRNVYWQMWDRPMFDATDPGECLDQIRRCRESFPRDYVRVTAYDASYGRQTTAISFIVSRPEPEPELLVGRNDDPGRMPGYSLGR